MSTPKERPILFSSTMVRAILDGAKTQTRRIIKNQPEIDDRGYISDSYWINKPFEGLLLPKIDDLVMYCPYGKPGDRLWVRETHALMDDSHCACYESCGKCVVGKYAYKSDGKWDDFIEKWTPSIHMPRRASRIDMEVTERRIERLQDISEEDAIAEGVRMTDEYTGCADDIDSHVHAYKFLWKSINGKGSWDLNPFVWVVEFKVISK